ncbi:MAG: cysteine dioxygenase family protein [Pseudomonadota bacterium]|nr:cysteine dioxygenase family protein [Pseudomonadota bacterium]
MADYSMDQFIADVKAVQAAHTDPKDILQRVAPLAQKIADAKDWVNDSHYRVEESQGIGITVIHEEPEDLLVETVCWSPGGGVLPHDHQTWGCVVGIDGAEKNVTWLRKDDGRKEGSADLENYHEMVMRHGDICTLLPNDIHSVHNEGDVPSVSLHIYGRSLAFTDRHEFDPEVKVVRPCPKRKRND